jgi:hypothetical protein
MQHLVRLPDFQTLDVRVGRRITRVTIDNNPIDLTDATLIGELNQLVSGWPSKAHGLRLMKGEPFITA